MSFIGVRAAVLAIATSDATWAVVIPVILIGVSASAKRLIRQSDKWEVSDLFVGVELTLAAFSNIALHGLHLCRKLIPSGASTVQASVAEQRAALLNLQDIGTQITTAAFCAFVAGVSVLILMLAHRELDKSTDEGTVRKVKVGALIAINWLIGAGLLVGYELFIKAPNG